MLNIRSLRSDYKRHGSFDLHTQIFSALCRMLIIVHQDQLGTTEALDV
jgi:hypothetical protein